MVRAFISVDFTDKLIQERIKDLQDEISSSGAHLRLVNTEILHITLEFLGDITEDQVTVVKEVLEELKFGLIKLNVKNPNVLPNENYIRVVYCELDGDIEPLKEIQKTLREKLRINGFKVDNRPFKPHLTIARVKSAKNRKELIRVIKQLSEVSCGIQEINTVNLKQSILKPEGPQYTKLHETHAKE